MAVLDVTEAELERLGELGSVEGQVALVLAQALDRGRNGMATSGDAARLIAVMELLRERSVVEADSVDDAHDEAARVLRAVG